MIALQADGQNGTVRGTAVDTEGKAVAGATVFAFPISGVPRLRGPKGVVTDGSGAFAVENLPFGEYRIETMKENDGYPRTYLEFYRVKNQATATITPDQPVAFVHVTMGPRAAVISGRALDEDTRETATHAEVRLWRLSDPGRQMRFGMQADFQVLIPPDEDIGFEIISDGHETWRVSDAPLHLASGSV